MKQNFKYTHALLVIVMFFTSIFPALAYQTTVSTSWECPEGDNYICCTVQNRDGSSEEFEKGEGKAVIKIVFK
jgi:hypothetical protein